jgi:CheY-like chemotaxis protein
MWEQKKNIAVSGKIRSERRMIERSHLPVASQSNSKTILLVDDEPGILKVCRQILEERGYRVLATSSPDEAIRLAIGHAGTIDLLLTDVIMPEMNGRELSARISGLLPNIRIMFMSGYMDNMFDDHGVVEGVNFISKPFSLKEFTTIIRNQLERHECP